MDLHATSPSDALEDISLREASRLYAVGLRTLQDRVRSGRLDAYKARGPWGREWRVTRSALEGGGYLPRPTEEDTGGTEERLARLERELAAARRAAAAERSRADAADRRLGQALMEAGRLRAALGAAEEHLDRDDVTTVDLTVVRQAARQVGVSGRSAAEV